MFSRGEGGRRGNYHHGQVMYAAKQYMELGDSPLKSLNLICVRGRSELGGTNSQKSAFTSQQIRGNKYYQVTIFQDKLFLLTFNLNSMYSASGEMSNVS